MQTESITWELVDREAAALGIDPGTRRKWRQPGRGVPPKEKLRIIDRLADRGVVVKSSDFDALPPNPGRLAA